MPRILCFETPLPRGLPIGLDGVEGFAALRGLPGVLIFLVDFVNGCAWRVMADFITAIQGDSKGGGARIPALVAGIDLL
jgi:hypothetical protein